MENIENTEQTAVIEKRGVGRPRIKMTKTIHLEQKENQWVVVGRGRKRKTAIRKTVEVAFDAVFTPGDVFENIA